MLHSELVTILADRTSVDKKSVSAVLGGLAAVVAEGMAKGEEVSVKDLGKFTTTATSEREGRNPQTGEPITIAASKRPRFKAAVAVRNAAKG